MANIIHHAKLGDLCYMKSPQSIHCWHGTITGYEQGFDIILASSNLDVADIDFIADIIQNWKYHEEKALEHIRVKLATQPELFNLSKEAGKNVSRLKDVPFDCPQYVFYEKQEWAIVFLENGLGIGEPFGVSVNFNGKTLTGIYDLSDAEEIEDE